ncbi:MAG: glycoside hydrolase family 20 zincin-like fold domain-containing protein, partial [Bacteroidales bacterium]|nr:glycoside hydrolase family 20 zincin-like fold domain-containing protein [Bacteroidales bacterium]
MVSRRGLIILAVLLVSCAKVQGPSEPQIIPQPGFLQMSEGSFRIDKGTTLFVEAGDSAVLRTVGFFNDRLKEAAGFTLKVVSDDPLRHSGEKGIFWLDAGLKEEAYSLIVRPDMVRVEYGSGAGAFYALQTILQLLPDAVFA